MMNLLRLIFGGRIVPVSYQKPVLVCYGCAHSASSARYPSRPSGERPCAFCIRNPNQKSDLAEIQAGSPAFVSPRYDNSPIPNPIGDQYIATYRLCRDDPKAMIIT